MTECRAALHIKGEHFPCDHPGGHPHTPWAHSNKDAQAIWGSHDEVEAMPGPAPVDEDKVD